MPLKRRSTAAEMAAASFGLMPAAHIFQDRPDPCDFTQEGCGEAPPKSAAANDRHARACEEILKKQDDKN